MSVLHMRTSHFLVQKTLDFSKFLVYPQGQDGLSQCGHFTTRVKGDQFFAILCGRVLWTAQNEVLKNKVNDAFLHNKMR